MATITEQDILQKENKLIAQLVRFREIGIVLILAILLVIVTVVEPRFLSANNIRSVLLWVPLLLIIAMGQMMVIITRGIDLSVGAVMAFSGIVVGLIWKANPDFNIYLSVLLGIFLGAVLGAVNGTMIAYFRIPPIIMTLGTLSAFRGLVFIVSGGRQIDPNDVPVDLIQWSQYGPFGWRTVPWVVFIALGVAVLTYLFLRFTKTGRNIYAIGGNPEGAVLRGISISRTTFIVYLICGALSGFAGILYASRFGFVNPGETGAGFELTVIAAVVIGGVNVFGGSGTVSGVVLGSLLLGVIITALAILGVAFTWQLAVYGLLIVVAVTVDAILQRELRRVVTGE
jgi:rhamnose transport system permease protein